MADIKVIVGGISIDERGKITYVNDFDMTKIKRFYIIHHHDIDTVRAWQAHQHEKKWFYCLKGSFTTAFVKIDNWENPSINLKPEIFNLSEKESKVICIPEGYANGIKANEPNSILMVFSDKILSEAVNDSWRYDKNMWMNWV